MAEQAGIQNGSWQQTMLRVKDPKKSLEFYKNIFGMTLIDKFSFPEMKFDIYFLETIKEGTTYDHEPGTPEAHAYLNSMKSVALELTHNYGTEEDADFKYNVGNVVIDDNQRDGFGHIAFNCLDVYEACKKMETQGVKFQKKPDEGRMKGLAFALDPDGYWVEIVNRSGENIKHDFTNYYNFSQTMLRVKDPKKTVPFYEALGLTLIRELHFNSFSLYFMGNVPDGVTLPAKDSDEARDYVKGMLEPVLELTHNHGTETNDSFQHFTGNEADRKGFGHVGFLVDDVDSACEALKAKGYALKKAPNDGSMKGLAFALDPDGYWVEIIKRGGYGDENLPYKKAA